MLPKKKILIATPCYGGVATCGYMRSLLNTFCQLRDAGHEVGLHMLESESLVSRARNTAATHALTGGFDKLLFIDADLTFTHEDVIRLLESDEMIVGGTYPLKNYPITINFNPLPDERALFGKHRQIDNYRAWVQKYANPETGEAEVQHIPTGFMMIDTRVLAKLTYSVPWYQSFNPDIGTTTQYYEFFPVRVVNNELQSEDWAFCEIARAAGFRITLQTKIVCEHIGTHYYRLGNHVAVGQTPVIA